MIESRKDFNALVEIAMADPALALMRPVVEKELLHYEIFAALDAGGLLKHLVFQGGTSLRLCRGSPRFSEDLDFAGGTDFSAASVMQIKDCLETHIGQVFALETTVRNKPSKIGERGIAHIRVDRWWISIETAPHDRSMPRQKIKLEIAGIPAHTRELVAIRHNYQFLGQSTVLVLAETLNEVMADKVLAFPTSLLDGIGRAVPADSNKIRYRDIWDLAWLSTQGAQLDPRLVQAKIGDYAVSDYPALLEHAIEELSEIIKTDAFSDQMKRFLDSATFAKSLANPEYLDYMTRSVRAIFVDMRADMTAAR